MKKRSALPVLVALLVGSASAGAATVLAKPLDLPLAGEGAVLSASFTNIQRPPGPTRPTSAHTVTSSQATPPATSPAPTTTPTTTSPPATSSSTEPPAPTSSTNPAPPPASGVDRVVELVNQARADAGCAPLQVEPHLVDAAKGHSNDMAGRNYFSHTTPEGDTFDERIKAAGYGLPGAENIAKGQKTADQVMTDWLKSPGHRANILNCQLKVIGVALNTNGFYWTQDFGY